MSTIKSSAENLTLNADGANNDIKFQSNGSEVAAIDQAGNLTLSGTVDGVDIQTLNTTAGAALPKAGGNMTGKLLINGTNTASVTNAATLAASQVLSVNSNSGEGSDNLMLGAMSDGTGDQFIEATNGGAAASYKIHLNPINNGTVVLGGGVAIGGRGAANTLDDYEEGTWTPTLIGSGGGTGTWGSSTNTYTKVGRMVTFNGYFQCTSLGNMSNAVIIGGLPFTNTSAGGYAAAVVGNATGLAITAGNCLTAFVDINSTRIYPRLWNATTGIAAYGFYIAELSADGSLMISGSYFAT